MKVFDIPYERLDHWSHTDIAYIRHDPALHDFIAYKPLKKNVKEVMANRKKFPVDRPLWLKSLKRQYAEIGFTLPYEDTVILNENTFTVTTAHQPALLTGPLFHIYKIASSINLAMQLREEHPDHRFIPVFVLGAEDHDWAELNHFYLFNKKHEWVHEASGPCGRLDLKGLDELISEVNEVFKNSPFGNNIRELLEGALKRSTNYAQFHQALLVSLFNEHGLVVFNMDDVDLKRHFIPIMEKELKEQFSLQHVQKTQEALDKKGFKAQAFTRPVNLFHMSEGLRERIDPTENGFVRVEKKVSYTTNEMIRELTEHPELFSPNVVLRPLYQENILPNLVYIGGGGELAYWLERKDQFEAAGIPFPMLIRRNSVLMIEEATSNQIDKMDLTWKDFMEDYEMLIKKYLRHHSEADLSFEKEDNKLKEAFESLAEKAKKIDPTLATAILAEHAKQSKTFEQLQQRIIRAEKHHQETNLKKIQKLKDKLFPDGKLQERKENFLSFYAAYGPVMIEELIRICDPFDLQFKVLFLSPLQE